MPLFVLNEVINMGFDKLIIYIMAVFAILGAADRIIGNKFGIGKEFEEGIKSIGSLALSMVGIITLTPLISRLLSPVIVPVYGFFGADPAMFAGTILANDMGGAALAAELAQSREAALFGGYIVSSMMGVTVVFTVPAALGIIEKKDRGFFAKGCLAGVTTIPVGAFVGGIAAGFPILMVLKNLIPIIIIAVLIVLGLIFLEKYMIKGFAILGWVITAVITFGLVCGILESLCSVTLIKGLTPMSEGFETISGICLMLAGAFPLIYTVKKVFSKPLEKTGKLVGINDASVAGILASLANSIPMFGIFKDMDERGKVVNAAFAVSGAFVFGDHLGFTASLEPSMIVPVILGKLVGGVSAVAVAMLLTRKKIKA